MSNGDKAAYPHGGFREEGLTKREMVSAMIFQQFLAGAVLPPGFDATEQIEFAAGRALEAADALIAAWEKF